MPWPLKEFFGKCFEPNDVAATDDGLPTGDVEKTHRGTGGMDGLGTVLQFNRSVIGVRVAKVGNVDDGDGCCHVG